MNENNMQLINELGPINEKTTNQISVFLDFLVIFHKDGLPIYSRCYSEVCSIFIKNNVLLSGFLSAIVSFPEALGENKNDLKSIKLGKTDMYFSYGSGNDLVYVVGVKNDKINNFQKELIDFSMSELNKIFLKYSVKNWSVIPDEIYAILEESINSKVVNHWFKTTNTHDSCPAGDNCPFHTVSKHGRRKLRIWDSFKQVYSKIRERNVSIT